MCQCSQVCYRSTCMLATYTNSASWSTSGRLLASGSDDHRINIHSYHPESSTSQFSLTTSIQTGHRSNIFSVKFMPYSNDRTIVSATDDVRIFEEHAVA
jgi:nuclear receptor interaction protein